MHQAFIFIREEQRWRRASVISALALFLIASLFVLPPFGHAESERVTIPEGTPVSEAARTLEEARVIRSSALFTLLVRTFGGARGVSAGTYVFDKPLPLFAVLRRVSAGDTGAPLVKVTIPEGATVRDIARLIAEASSGFDEAAFVALAGREEGYLFPETYFFPSGVTPEAALAAMRAEFDARITELEGDISVSGKSLRDVVIMASLLEKEARKFETRRTVAGILWKRLELGMPLQVDAVFGYILGTDTFSPTFDQLKLDSPYNTYTHVGLPPGPIGNPGIDSLKAALNPNESPYFFYLTGADGTMHYAKTFDEHVANRRYLK